MHETNKTILNHLPGTIKEVAEKTGLSEKVISKRLRFMLLLKRVAKIGKRERKFSEGLSPTVYGKLDDGNDWLDSSNWFGKK